jgi:hypothetical protein
MNEEIGLLIGGPLSPLKRVRDKRKAEELRNVVAGDAPAPLRLRAALAGSLKPPDELLEARIIGQAVRLDDCFKFLPQLSPVRRIIEAGPVLEAIKDLLRQRGHGNASVLLARCLKLSQQWEGGKNPTTPSDKTVNQYLRLVESIVEQPIAAAETKKAPKKPKANPLPLVLSGACRWAIRYRGVDNISLAVRSLNAVERREGAAVTDLYSDVPGFAAEVSNLRSGAISLLESAARGNAIDDCRNLLLALTGSVEHRREMDGVIRRLHQAEPPLDPAIMKVLSEFAEIETAPSMTIRFAGGGEPTTGAMQLASVLLKAWAARNDAQSSGEIFEKLAWVLEDFFFLRLRNSVGEKENYDPRFHEFQQGEAPTSTVEIIRPGVERLDPAETGMVIKALVKGVAS